MDLGLQARPPLSQEPRRCRQGRRPAAGGERMPVGSCTARADSVCSGWPAI